MASVSRRYSRIAHAWLVIAMSVAAQVWFTVAVFAERPSSPPDRAFLQTHCLDCHQGAEAGGGLDLSKLGQDLSDAKTLQHWIRIADRVAAGEMPPKEAEPVELSARTSYVQTLGDWLRSHRRIEDASLGRVRGRRLTRRELERSLQDLLGIDIPLADQLPEEANSAEFSTVANGQAMSHFQLERHVAVVDVALDEAFRRALSPEDRYDRELDTSAIARRPDRGRTREPEIIDGRAVTWSSGLIFYGRIPATTAPENGWYRFRVRVAALKPPKTGGVWCTVRSGLCVSSAPLLGWVGAFEAIDQPREIDLEAWLPKGHMLEIRPGDATLKKARFAGGQVGNGEGEPQNVPGIALDHITMNRFHRGLDNAGIRQLLFDDLKFENGRKGRLRPRSQSQNHREDIQRLVTRFAERAFRRPVSEQEIAPFVRLALSALDPVEKNSAEENHSDKESSQKNGTTENGVEDFTGALRLGYRAILCSPRFLYFTEKPGKLDDYAIGTRLSYFLTGSTPDGDLLELAAANRLHEPSILRGEVDRLLTGPQGRRFIQDFSAEWLDLDLIDFTEPDRKLHPDFDSIVQQSMLDETHTYLETMLRENLSITHLIDSDFTFLNSRLARFYDIDSVTGDKQQRVALEPQHHRGGVLTQGAILKVTANGSNTSPVVRGVWVSERLLGEPIPPPPGNVPAIEPDIRGAKTIREMLAKHRAQDSCASCHVKIDPPGFALENFDPAGKWRDRYVQLVRGRTDRGAKIDASYELLDGRKFENVDEFRELITKDSRPLARNVAEKLLVFGTGAPISFADRQSVDDIVEVAERDDYGFRSILHAVVASHVFLSK